MPRLLILAVLFLFVAPSKANADGDRSEAQLSPMDRFVVGVARTLHIQTKYANYSSGSSLFGGRFVTRLGSADAGWRGRDSRIVFGFVFPIN